VVTALGLEPEQVEVISPFAGGGFGQKNSLQMQTVLAAVAARRTGRPVKLVVPRAGVFHDASFRPASRHHIRLGADKSGKMLAAIHEVDAQTSRHDLFPGEYAATSSRLYGYQNFRGSSAWCAPMCKRPAICARLSSMRLALPWSPASTSWLMPWPGPGGAAAGE